MENIIIEGMEIFTAPITKTPEVMKSTGKKRKQNVLMTAITELSNIHNDLR